MKSKVLVIILVLIIVALLIILGIQLFKKEPKPLLLREAEAIWIPPHSEDGKKIVSDHIADIEKELAAMSWEKQENEPLLPDTQINRICTFFENRGFMCKHNGNPARKEQQIRRYLSQERENITKIKFELLYFASEELIHNVKKPPSEQKRDDIHHVVQLGIKVSYIHDGNHIDPPGGRDDYHIQDCTWIP